jgi:hypothetical protein
MARRFDPPPPRWPDWGWNRSDRRDYARLASMLGPRLLPVRPVGRKAPHVKGQLALWAGAPSVGPGLAMGEEVTSP